MPTPEEPRLSSLIGALAGRLERGKLATGDRAALRRMQPRSPGAAILPLARLLDECGIDAPGEAFKRWALLVHCLALCNGSHSPQWDRAAGRVLAREGLSEGRLTQLLSADLDILFGLLPSIARRFADIDLNWTQLASLPTARAGDGRSDRSGFKPDGVRCYIEPGCVRGGRSI